MPERKERLDQLGRLDRPDRRVTRESLEIKELLDRRDQQAMLVLQVLLGRKVHRAWQVGQDRQVQQDLLGHKAHPEIVDPLVPPVNQEQQGIRDHKALQVLRVHRETKVYLVPLDSMASKARPVRPV